MSKKTQVRTDVMNLVSFEFEPRLGAKTIFVSGRAAPRLGTARAPYYVSDLPPLGSYSVTAGTGEVSRDDKVKQP